MTIDFTTLQNDVEQLTSDQVVTYEDSFGTKSLINCHIDLTIRRIGETYDIQADVSGGFSTPCHRCLEPAGFDVNSSFRLLVQRGGERWEGDEESKEDHVYLPVGQHELSLDERIQGNVVVNIPIQIVCREQCKGLCPTCGVNLNCETCTCAPAVDSRWDALRKLKKKSSG